MTSKLSLTWTTVAAVLVAPIAGFAQDGGIHFVQETDNTVAGGSPYPQSFTGGVVPTGHLIVVALTWDPLSAASSTVTDDCGDTFYAALGPTPVTGIGWQMETAYAIVACDAGVTTVTTDVPGYNGLEVVQIEYSGVDPAAPLDSASELVGSGGGRIDSGSLTTTADNDLLVGWASADVTINAGAGWTVRSPIDGDLVEDQIAGDAGSYTGSASLSSGGWGFLLAAFRPLAASALDAGTDAGQLDGGTDAGQEDSGQPDAGDGGFLPVSLDLAVGCDCGAAGQGVWPAVCFVIAAGAPSNRRRRRSAHSTCGP